MDKLRELYASARLLDGLQGICTDRYGHCDDEYCDCDKEEERSEFGEDRCPADYQG